MVPPTLGRGVRLRKMKKDAGQTQSKGVVILCREEIKIISQAERTNVHRITEMGRVSREKNVNLSLREKETALSFGMGMVQKG